MIAAVAIEHAVPLLHADRDFDPIATHRGLEGIDADDESAIEQDVEV